MLARVDQDRLDTGPKGSGGERFCAVTREAKSADAMIRFVLDPDGRVVADLKRRLPGRGLWVTATKDALAQAARRNVFAKGFKTEVRLSADFVESTDRLLERSALDALAIANKAGAFVSGFAKVETAIAQGDIVALMRASEASADGIRKLDAAMHRRFGADTAGIAIIGAFSTAQLDLASGRSNVVHAALLAGPASDAFLARYSRLMRFRTGEAGGPEHDETRPEKPEGLESE